MLKFAFCSAALVLLSGMPARMPAQTSVTPADGDSALARLEQPAALPSALPAENTAVAVLPDAPSAVLESLNADGADAPKQPYPPPSPVAGRFATIILPGQKAQELHGMEKAVFGLHDAFNPLQLAGIATSAGWSHLINSQPHYGTNSEAFGKRFGAAALRSTIQTLSTDAVFSPMFHDDPRYFVMGYGHPFVNRVLYAASRVVVVKSSHSDKQRVNAPLLLGYAVTAATNNAYYPDQDRGFKNTMENWGTSLVGAGLGFEVDEFLDDTLRFLHVRK